MPNHSISAYCRTKNGKTMENTVSQRNNSQKYGENNLGRSSHRATIKRVNFEKTVKLAIPVTIGFWALLISSAAYSFSYMSSGMNKPFSTFLVWIVCLSVIFSLFIYVIVTRLVKMLKTKTHELEQQKINLEEQVMQKTNELLKAEKLSAIGELSARIAHDIRNPVSIIKNTVEIMKMRNQFDEKIKTDFQRIEKALERIAHQVNDVLDFVRDAPLKLEACFISDIINTAVSTITFPDRIKLKVFPSDIPIQCDPIKIEAVIRNLILNAIQAITKEGKISIRVIEKHGMAIIEVENSGSGIPDSVLPKIFDPLFTTKQQGTGLGLPICKTIIEKHGGKISASTTENRGSTFVVELPKIKVSEILSQQVFSVANMLGGERRES